MSIVDRKLLIILITLVLFMTIVSIPNNQKMGEIYFKSYKYDLALEYYNKAKALDSNSPIILRQLKDYFLIQGEVEKALQVQQKITQVLSKNTDELQELAKLYEWNNQPYEALKAQERLARLLPRDEQLTLYNNIGQGYRWLRKYDDVDRIAEYLDRTEKTAYLISVLEFYISSSNFPKVIELTNKLESLGANSQKFKLVKAQSLEAQGRVKDAITGYKSALSDNPSKTTYEAYEIIPSVRFYSDNYPIYQKIISLYERLEDKEYLLKLYNEIYRIVPGQYEIGLKAAQTHIQANQPEEAKAILGSLYKTDDHWNLYQSAIHLKELGQLKLARRHLEKAYKLAPNEPLIIDLLSDVYEDLGNHKRALKLQYRLLRILKRSSMLDDKFHYQYNFYLVAQSGGRLPRNQKREKIKSTQERILYLLSKIGDKNTRHSELLRYVKLYPLDTNFKKDLAYSHVERGEEDQALAVFQDIYQINPLDRDATIYIADHHLKNGDEAKAIELLERIPPKMRNSNILNKLEASYRQLGDEKAQQICSEVTAQKKSPGNDYALADLLARCYGHKKQYAQAVDVLTDYLRTDSSNDYAKLNLAYALAHDNRFNEAHTVANQVDTKEVGRENLRVFRRYAQYLETRYNHSNAWEVKSYIHLFSQDYDGLSYWDFDTKVLKHFAPFAAGASYSLQDPIYNSSLISDLKLHLLYENIGESKSEVYVGKNVKNSTEMNYGLHYEAYLSPKSSFVADVHVEAQEYTLDVFTSAMKPTKDTLSLSYFYNSSERNSYYYQLGLQRYNIKPDESLTYAGASFQWLRKINPVFRMGPYLSYQVAIQKDPFIQTLLASQTSTQCLKFHYITHPWQEDRDYTNEIEGCFGLGQSKTEGFGFFASIEDIYKYEINKASSFEARLKLDQIILNRNTQILSLYLGYQRWFF